MTERHRVGTTQIIRVRHDRTTSQWHWECRACSSYPTTGGTEPSQPAALAQGLAHVAERGHEVCRCEEPGADPWKCGSDNCCMYDRLLSVWLTPLTGAQVNAALAGRLTT